MIVTLFAGFNSLLREILILQNKINFAFKSLDELKVYLCILQSIFYCKNHYLQQQKAAI